MIDDEILASINSRLSAALAAPRIHYRPLLVDGHVAGWLDVARAAQLAAMPEFFQVDARAIQFVAGIGGEPARTEALARVAARLARNGALTAWRDERYAVEDESSGAVLFEIERAAARFFGIHTRAAHVNGLVRTAEGACMWFARRSPAKAIEPGKLDNLVGGGVAAGVSIAATVSKESWEEAGIGPRLAREAKPAGLLHVRRDQPDGLQDETIFVHDLWLPATFAPANQDGEVVAHRLVPLGEAARLVACASGDDEVTVDASLVVLDCLLRIGAIAPGARDYGELSALRGPAFRGGARQ